MDKIIITPQKLFFVFLGMLLLTIIGTSYGFIILKDQLTQDVNNINEAELAIEISDLEIAAIDNSLADYRQYKSIEAGIDTLLPSEKEQSQAIAAITNVFSDAGVDVTGLSFASTEGAPGELSQTVPSGIPGVVSLPVSVNITDQLSYGTIIDLLKKLESSGRHISISRVNVSASDRQEDGTPSGLLTLNVSFNIQLLGQPPAPATPATDAAATDEEASWNNN